MINSRFRPFLLFPGLFLSSAGFARSPTVDVRTLVITILLLLPAPLFAASTPALGPGVDELQSGQVTGTADAGVIRLPRRAEDSVDIQVDGRPDEPIWQQLPYVDDMAVVSPDTGEPAMYATRTRLLYTERGLYVAVWNQQPPESLIARLSSRDSFMTRDSYQLILDTTGEGLYGYWFEVSLGGALGDGIVLPERNFQRSWDGPWRGESARTDDGWTLEMFLPWSMMNMPPAADNVRRMGVYASRRVAHINQRWGWPYLPQTGARFMSALQPVEVKDVSPRQEYSIYPFASASRDVSRGESEYKAGVDAFWRPSASFQVNATLSPDFGQVEADNVVINFTAFETFFPEKRLFFLENQEIFTTSPRGSTLLHTRRIGSSVNGRRGSPDAAADVVFDSFASSQPVDLIAAVKTVGQAGPVRYGLLAASEDDTDLTPAGALARISASGRDFGVARVSFEDAGGGGRRAVGWLGTVTDHPGRQAITQGIDGHLLSENGKISVDAQIMASDVPEGTGEGVFVNIGYAPRRGVQHKWSLDYLDDTIDINDLGFLGRNDLVAADYSVSHRENNVPGLRDRDTSFNIDASFNTDNVLLGGRARLRRQWGLLNNHQVRGTLDYRPTHWDDRNAFGNGNFRRNRRWSGQVRWDTDFARDVVYSLEVELDEESEGGLRGKIKGQLFLRPSDRLSVSLRAEYTERDAWLIYAGGRDFTAYKSAEWQPRISVGSYFTANQQLQFEMQWVGIKAAERRAYELPVGGGSLNRVARDPLVAAKTFAISDLTIQLRYRWEIAPLSDLFVVYNRGGRYSDAGVDDSFPELFDGALGDPQREFLIMKLRYRIGS